jgi:hypothetical protein
MQDTAHTACANKLALPVNKTTITVTEQSTHATMTPLLYGQGPVANSNTHTYSHTCAGAPSLLGRLLAPCQCQKNTLPYLRLRVNHERPAACARHHYAVVDGEGVIGEACNSPGPDFDRVTQGGDERELGGPGDAKVGGFGHPFGQDLGVWVRGCGYERGWQRKRQGRPRKGGVFVPGLCQ